MLCHPDAKDEGIDEQRTIPMVDQGRLLVADSLL